MFSSLSATLKITGLAFMLISGLVLNTGTEAKTARELALSEDADTARIERLFSQRPTQAGPAPKTWSSRLEIRWNARWHTSPRYAV